MSIRRALVLGSGGAPGVAWELGVVAGLADAGVDVAAADLVVGTSAGALAAAWLAAGPVGEVAGRFTEPLAGASPALPGRVGAAAVARLLAAQLSPSRRLALSWLGRRAAAASSAEAQDAWVSLVAPGLSGRPWPETLVVVATDAGSGRPAYFSARRPVELAAAVAASCAVPGMLPAVRIEGRLFFDGGLRSPANLDVADSADRVLAITPLTGSLRAHRRPSAQAAHLRSEGHAVVAIAPTPRSRSAMGPDFLDPGRGAAAFRAGVADARRHVDTAGELWRS